MLTIGNNAFDGCAGITSIEFPFGSSLTGGIGDGAFDNCTLLTELNWGVSSSSRVPFGTNTFGSTTSSPVTTLNILDGVTNIGYGQFTSVHNGTNIRNLTTINFPGTLTTIGTYAFANCTKLVTLVFPASLRTIELGSFGACTGLSSLDFSAVTLSFSILSQAFMNCTKLVTLVFPASLTSIGSSAFNNCNITSITFPHGSALTSIGNGAFGNNNITTLNWGVNRTGSTAAVTFGTDVFGSQGTVTTLNILEGVTGIANNQFNSIATNMGWTESLTTLNLPTTLVNIGDYAFNGCSQITSLSFTSSPMTIGDYAFNGCTSLETVEFLRTTLPTIGTNNFTNSLPAGTGNTNYYVRTQAMKDILRAGTHNIDDDYIHVMSPVKITFNGTVALAETIVPATISDFIKDNPGLLTTTGYMIINEP